LGRHAFQQIVAAAARIGLRGDADHPVVRDSTPHPKIEDAVLILRLELDLMAFLPIAAMSDRAILKMAESSLPAVVAYETCVARA